MLPNYITALYSGCLRRGVFPKRWKKVKLIPITKPGKENSDEVSKFRPISLLNVGGKVLESLNKQNKLPCRFTRLYEHPPVGLTPQRGTIDEAMAIKEFVKDG